jgi:hypothetical protein
VISATYTLLKNNYLGPDIPGDGTHLAVFSSATWAAVRGDAPEVTGRSGVPSLARSDSLSERTCNVPGGQEDRVTGSGLVALQAAATKANARGAARRI